jgi:hypothetical protein
MIGRSHRDSYPPSSHTTSTHRWNHYSPELHATFQTMLMGFKQMAGSQWPTYFARFPEAMQAKLLGKFTL